MNVSAGQQSGLRELEAIAQWGDALEIIAVPEPKDEGGLLNVEIALSFKGVAGPQAAFRCDKGSGSAYWSPLSFLSVIPMYWFPISDGPIGLMFNGLGYSASIRHLRRSGSPALECSDSLNGYTRG